MIILKDTNEQIGTIDINNTWSKYGCVEPGCIIARKHWKKGYATETMMAVMKYLFEECDVQTIYSEFMEDNIASGRVIQKCGMIQEGILRNRCEDKVGKRQNLLSYSIIRDEFYEKYCGKKVGEKQDSFDDTILTEIIMYFEDLEDIYSKYNSKNANTIAKKN